MRIDEFPSRVVVVIPAHDESAHLPRCVESIRAAAGHVPSEVLVVVVLDSCTDGSAQLLAGRYGGEVHVLEVEERNVGAARAAGFAHARAAHGAEGIDESGIWYATTDADTTVDPDWLLRQCHSAADMVLGVVRITEWRRTPVSAIRRYLEAYRAKIWPDGHGHVHGANMGFRADAYWRAGGFASLRSDEDVDLVRRFEQHGLGIDRDRRLSVATSARPVGRAPRGFAGHLRSMRQPGRQETS